MSTSKAKQRKTKGHRRQKQKEIPLPEQDDTFFFIAGYTSGGAPYGVTWEEMGLEPWEEIEWTTPLQATGYPLLVSLLERCKQRGIRPVSE